jgi:hypothetical protein
VPAVGIPFYLADERLRHIEEEQTGEVEGDRVVMMLLRHEVGHAFNYAYRLWKRRDWPEIFGGFSKPYREEFRPNPFSRQFVRHLVHSEYGRNYAQKHPDEDFAETFAVWLTPRSQWRVRYKSWPAIRKLRYVDQVVRRVRAQEPVVSTGDLAVPVEDLKVTVEQFYRRLMRQNGAGVKVALEADLSDLFIPQGRRRKGIRPAWELVEEHRKVLTDKITYWTGVRRPVVRALVEHIVRASRDLRLFADTNLEADYLVELTAYGTTLAMNYLTRRRFEQK